MSDTGFVIAGLGANTGSGTTWLVPTNIQADDGTYATAQFSSAGDSTVLRASTFGLSIPSTATVTGIEVKYQLRRFLTGAATIKSINVGKDNSTLGTAVTPGTGLTSSDLDYTAGGDGSLWGLSWSVAEVQASTFQTQLVCTSSTSGTNSIYCDAAWVKVYYTASTGAKSYGVVVF